MFIITLISLLRVRKHLIYKSIDVAKIGIIIDNCKTFIDKLKTFNILHPILCPSLLSKAQF